MKSEIDIAFKLLRAALEGHSLETADLEASQWWGLFRLLQKNHVEALCFDALVGAKVPREVLSREQEARLAAYVRRLVKRRDKVAAKLIQISAEEDNFDAIISSFHALPEDDRTILQEMIFLGVKGSNVCISRGCRTDRTVWRHRKAALDRIVVDCSRKRGVLP
jgi:hypothetical protein